MPSHPKSNDHPFLRRWGVTKPDSTIADLGLVKERYPELEHAPHAIRLLVENIARHIDGVLVEASDIAGILGNTSSSGGEVSFTPSRVVMQDFTGVPALVDFATMRDRLDKLGHPVELINPLVQTDLVIDHSVSVDSYGRSDSLLRNMTNEYARNRERYEFLRWGQNALKNFRLVPPATGIVHQINLEYLAEVVMKKEDGDGRTWVYPDTVVGTDSHTTMINGLGVLGWGVGGIEAEAAMLGQPIVMAIPKTVGVCLKGELPTGSTATDLVLRITEVLRQHGVVGKFVEFYGSGLDHLDLANRATVANMAPEYGATCAYFPIDDETLNYLALTNRDQEKLRLIEEYYKYQDMWRNNQRAIKWDEEVEIDVGKVEPSLAGPARPQDRITLRQAPRTVKKLLEANPHPPVAVQGEDHTYRLKDGSVVIAAITSCTNTSNPSVIIGAGLMARKARELGLQAQPWVKTSLAPGSRVVTGYLKRAKLLEDLESIGFNVVGYGCTTCIGNSGALDSRIARAITEGELNTCAVLSGNRNFEGRVHPLVRMNFLASPLIVVAYALVGRMDIDFSREAIGTDSDNRPVYLSDIWPSTDEIAEMTNRYVNREIYASEYRGVFAGDQNWKDLKQQELPTYRWDEDSTYIRRPSFLDRLDNEAVGGFSGLRVLAVLKDSITTDHISPAGAIGVHTPAAKYLQECGVKPDAFNSYGSRRGNHEVMVRGTFANIRLRNQLVPGREGGYTLKFPEREETSIFDAAMRYRDEGVSLLVIAGKEYGSGSSRDWAAKGTLLLGVKAVLAVSYERIHRSNLIGMGVLPLQFKSGESAESLNLTGTEVYQIGDIEFGGRTAKVSVTDENGRSVLGFEASIRIDTPREWEYYRAGGILPYVLDQLIAARQNPS